MQFFCYVVFVWLAVDQGAQFLGPKSPLCFRGYLLPPLFTAVQHLQKGLDVIPSQWHFCLHIVDE